ncbi:MAG: Gfo/Idh/MocA family oxidoreductase [Bacilli bacterium]|nr:Gfo/Idh/MocA family oxidoreductase [Bacilli bacterium]
MKKVRYGIIGVGNMGSQHLDKFENGEVANAVVTAIADLKESKLKAMVEKYPNAQFRTYKNGAELIEKAEVDAVIVAVPHYDHPSLSIQALNKGIHVICEKPAGVYTKQVKEMNAAAENSEALFTMMFNQRTNSLYRKMRELIVDGEIGLIKRINWIITTWYRSQSYFDSGDWRATWEGEGGGVLFNQSPHQLDLISWVTGMMPNHIHAFCHFGKWHDIEVEDDVTAYLEYENGATGVFITSTADAPGTNRFEVLGTKGKLVCENNELVFFKNKIDERKFNETHQGGFGQPEFEVLKVETDGKNPQHVGILRNFTNAILGTEALFVDGVEGLNGVILMDAMLLSTWLKRGIDLPFDDDLYLEELNKRRKASKKKATVDTVLNTEGTY